MSVLAILLKPFVVIVGLIALYYVRIAVIKWWPEGKLKRLLLRRSDT